MAIIVILAIIAVITVPIILNVIEDAKKGAAKDSAYGYKDAINKYYVSELYENLGFNLDGSYIITDKGRLSNDTGVHEIPFTGTTPTGGYLTYQNNILTDGCITMDEYKVTVSDGEVTTVEKGSCDESKPQVAYKCKRATELHTEICNYAGCQGEYSDGDEIEYGRLGSGDELVSGDAFDCAVKDTNGDSVIDEFDMTERFYYVSDLYIRNNNETNEPEFDSNYAVLIYYNNTVGDQPNNSTRVAYDVSGENWHGPLTAATHMPTTSDWSNIRLTNTSRQILNEKGKATTDNNSIDLQTFSYEGYAARLLTTQELEMGCGTVGSYSGELDSCNYLLENTQNSNLSLAGGFWLETPCTSGSNDAWDVVGTDRMAYFHNVSLGGANGSRPVIEVLKTDIKL